MNAQQALQSTDARTRALAGLPVVERRLELASISTTVLEGGTGTPMVLLHGPGAHAAKWMRVIPDLVRTCRIVAPDLPGHGSTEVGGGSLDVERVLAWLAQLIERTCARPPVLVGHIIGGAVAARFASRRGESIRHLVLADALGLAPFQPAPEFGRVLMEYVMQPAGETHDRLWQRCAFDLDHLRDGMGEQWDLLRAYNLDRAGMPRLQEVQQELMAQFGMPAIPEAELAGISVPTTLVWGRHDLATSLSVAEAASTRYGWPLHVIEDAANDPAIEQPDALVKVLRAVCEQ
jgi:pimeloyl-ACP methyl ester carboxylesterase